MHCLRVCCVLVLVVKFGASRSAQNFAIIATTTDRYVQAEFGGRQGRGVDYHHMVDEEEEQEEEEEEEEEAHGMQEEKAVKEDPWNGYYDFIINEGSFKFWAVFQLVTAVLLIYSALAAVYYAKFNVITTDFDDYDFLGRSSDASESLWSGLTGQTFQRILDAISSKKYS